MSGGIGIGQKKGDDVWEEVDIIALERFAREEDGRLLILDEVGQRRRFNVPNLPALLQLHNDFFCIAAMQRKHGCSGDFLGMSPNPQAIRAGGLAVCVKPAI